MKAITSLRHHCLLDSDATRHKQRKAKKHLKAVKGNHWLKSILVEYCNGVALTKKGFLREIFQKTKERRGRNRAILALAHKVLRIIYAMFKNGTDYLESTEEVLRTFRAKRLAKVMAQAERANLTIENGTVFDRTTGVVLHSGP